MFDLNERRQDIIAVATELFEKFVNMPKDVRPDDKERTGIQVLVWEPGTRNLVLVSVKEPSEAAKFFVVEKAVRANTNSHYSSENSADQGRLMFPGSISLKINDCPALVSLEGVGNRPRVLIASVSGLKSEEDVAISAAILAKITGLTVYQICDNVNHNDGILPDWFYDNDAGYFEFLFE